MYLEYYLKRQNIFDSDRGIVNNDLRGLPKE